jgi:hypothetical protein
LLHGLATANQQQNYSLISPRESAVLLGLFAVERKGGGKRIIIKGRSSKLIEEEAAGRRRRRRWRNSPQAM